MRTTKRGGVDTLRPRSARRRVLRGVSDQNGRTFIGRIGVGSIDVREQAATEQDASR